MREDENKNWKRKKGLREMVRISKGKNGKRWIMAGNGKGGIEIFVHFIVYFYF